MEATKRKLLDKLGKKGFDTEKKVNAIDMRAAVDNGFTMDDLSGILDLQNAIRTHTVYSFLMDGTDAKPEKKEAKKNADDDRSAGSGIQTETSQSFSYQDM